MYIIDIAIDHKNHNLANTFSYYVTKDQFNQLVFSSCVLVNFNNQKKIGFVVNKYIDENKKKLKTIDKVLASDLLNEKQITLAKYLYESYICSYYEILNLLIPKKLQKTLREFMLSEDVDIKTQVAYEIIEEDLNLTKRQMDIILAIKNGLITKFEIKQTLGVSDSVFKILEDREIIKRKYIPFDYTVDYDFIDKEEVILSHQQRAAYKEITLSDKPFLLHGVTGSGKTEIYIKLLKDVVMDGNQGLLLVPEKTLTIAFSARLKNIFGNKIAYITSDTSDDQLYNYYQKIKSGVIKLVIGTRSSIFMPFNNLALVVIDEEHDMAYKSNISPFYHTSDIALYFYNNYNTRVLMGSATPSIDTYARCQKNIFDYHKLTHRFNQTNLPVIDIQKVDNHDLILTTDTLMHIKTKLNNNEKVVVLYNQKGHSKQVECNNCHHVLLCPNCNVGLRYYKSKNTLSCGFCGYKKPLPNSCPKCSDTHFKFLGVAIEKVYEYLDKYFNKKVVLLDGELAKKKRYLDDVMKRLYSDESFILLGTQIVSKGLDISDVNLVVIPNVDNALFFDDLKARERLYQLLVQVSGRAGRVSGNGHVILQTMYPNYKLFENVVDNNYEEFYRHEMKLRQHYKTMPYYNICMVKVKHTNELVAYNFLKNLLIEISNKKDEYICSQVIKPYVNMQFNKYIFTAQIKYLRSDIYSDLKPLYNKSIKEGVLLIIDTKIEDKL